MARQLDSFYSPLLVWFGSLAKISNITGSAVQKEVCHNRCIIVGRVILGVS